MKPAKFLAAIAAFLTLGAASAAQAVPCVEFQTLVADVDINYNPFSPAPTNVPFTLRVIRRDNAVTSVRFIFVDSSPSGGQSRIGTVGPKDYDISWLPNTAQTMFYPTEHGVDATNGATVTFGAGVFGSQQSTTFMVHVPPGQSVPATHQFEDVSVRFQCYAGTTPYDPPGSQDDNRVQLDLQVQQIFGAFLGGVLNANTGDIDFGVVNNLGASPQRSIAVTTVATMAYDIAVTTERGQALRRNIGDPIHIPYTMTLGTTPVSEGQTLNCPVPSGIGGTTQNLAVTLDNAGVTSLPSGHYRDTITLTITPFDGPRPGPGCTVQ